MVDAKLMEVEVKDLVLDPDNPRFFYRRLTGGGSLTDADLEEEIAKDDALPALIKAIRVSGVQDPIWVREEDGKYVVIEGNRRTVVLRRLLKEGARPTKEGVDYSRVKAHVIPTGTSPTETLLQKARLQTGKKEWGAFNVAAVTYTLRHQYLMDYDDIAAEMQTSREEVKSRLKNYELFLEYASKSGDDNPRRFVFFTDRPARVVEWMEQTDANKLAYFEWINPKSGKQKLRSVATRGGVREFAKVLEDADVTKLFIEDPHLSVEDALELVKQNDIYKELSFVKGLPRTAQQLFSLTDDQIEKLKQEPKIQAWLKSLERACVQVLKKLE